MPALRISHIVYGRENRRGKVLYFLNSNGEDSRKYTGEQVALRRWRARKLKGHIFGGTRLSPTIWRAIKTGFTDPAQMFCLNDADKLSPLLAAARYRLQGTHLSLPSAEGLAALFEYVGRSGLNRLLERHGEFDRSRQSGVPDLFLFARETDSRKLAFARFVEVKRPGERVSADQTAEHAFLNSLGLSVRVLRLIERT